MRLILGIILLAAPFLLVTRFKDKKLGFSYILSFILALQLSIAVFTQAIRAFTYPVVSAINFVVFLVILGIFYRNRLFRRIKLDPKSFDWILVFVIFISFLNLHKVHYNYTGKYTIATSPEYQEAKNARYSYPYFADEWYAVTLIKDSIDTHFLPIRNPLRANKLPLINFELPFHSFLSEIVLLLGLNPLVDYSKMAIFFGILIVTLIYLLLRQNKVEWAPSAIASLSALYIANSGNLQALWVLFPLTIGLVAFLLSLIFISANSKKMILFTSFLTLLFYPPLVVFSAVGLLVNVFTSQVEKKEKIKILAFYSIFALVAAAVISTVYFMAKRTPGNFLNYLIFSKILYPTFAVDSIPRYPIFYVIPFPIILFSGLGIFAVLKKKPWLSSMVFVGLFYWILYSFVTFRFVIGYQRLVVAASILIIIVAGFGLNFFVRILRDKIFLRNEKVLNYVLAGAVIIFLLISAGYTKREGWMKFKLVNIKTRDTYLPASFANRYLHPDDLELFKDTKGKTFLTLPWKGTVIGVATDNYPLLTKEGTISNKYLSLKRFIKADCDEKEELAKKVRLDYFYGPEFNCPSFEFVGKSGEGLYLYGFESKIEE